MAVEVGYRGYFTTANHLCRTLVRASHDGSLTSKMTTFTAPTMLVIDLCRGGDYADRLVGPAGELVVRGRLGVPEAPANLTTHRSNH